MVLFTLLGVIALVQRERRKVNNTDSGRDEKVEQSDVPPVRSPDVASLGQTSQHISTDPAVLPNAEEPFTCHPEVHEDSSDESLIQDLVGDLSERSADVLSGVVCKCEVDSFQTVPELSVAVPTTEEPITGHPEVDLVNIPQTSASPAEDTVAPQSSQLEENETTVMGINSCSDEIGIELSEGGFGFVHSEICMDDQVAVKLPSFKYIYFQASEALPSELQDQHSEDEETYGALDTETKSDSEVPEVPVPADDTPEGLNKVLSGLYWRRKNCWVRGILTLAMISGIFSSIYLGPMALMTVVLCVQIKCFQQMITIGYHWYRLPWFRTLSWYFLLYVNYYFHRETPTDNFFTLVQREEPIRLLSQSHRFISFALYLAGFCMFVLSLVKRRRRLQFYMFGWTLMILATLSQLIIRNLFEGMIWFIVPISCAIYNGLRVWLLFWSHPSLQVVS